MDLCEHGVASLRNALLSGATSCVEHATALIARTQALAHLNGYVDFDPVPFLAQARQADVDIARGVSAPLLGVPLALKDNINTTGFPTGVGTRTLRGRIPAADAEIVKRLKQSGAIISGKAGMHELAFGISSNNGVTGAIRNPWALDRIPGGSSGGSAVVVAAGLVPGAIGTDTGASVRLPAALCGIAGLRPTVGRVPGTGIAPISSTRDTAGPMARSIADLALLDTALTGDAAGLAKVDLRGLRLGIPNDRFWTPLDASVAAVMDDTRKELQRAGVDFVELDLPGLDALNNSVGFPVGLFEFMAEMPDYLKASGHPLDIEALLAGIGSPDVAGILRPLLGSGAIPEPVYRAALADRQRLQELYRRTFAQHQVRALAFPTSALTARPLGTDDTVEFLGQRCPAFMIYIRNTDPGSNAGIPGLSLPAGIGPDGLPVGLELDGPAGSDRDLLAIGAALETVLPPIGRPSLRSPEGA
uniref:IaaH n=3 Tax=Betaproteobacteria TaxID=28216 RepID=Q6QHP2_ACHDE|nr:indole acetamide hydrolase [Burkholderia cepacia]AAS49442.1 IaaH [Achromobacter denitrificans]